MTRRARVIMADPDADRPSAATATLITVFALCAGIASAYALQRASRSAHVPAAEAPAHEDRTSEGAEEVANTNEGAEAVASQSASAAAVASTRGSSDALRAAHAPIARGVADGSAELVESSAGAALPAAPAGAAAPDAGLAEEPASTAPGERPAAESFAATPADALAAVPPSVPSAPPAPQPEAPPTAAASERAPQVVQGQVAYLRCEGVRQRRGRIPCPRDLALEEAVWAAVAELERCPELRGQRGRGEVRLDFKDADAAPSWRVRSARLDRQAVGRCAGSRLAAVRTALRPTRMIVSFRFELR